MCQKPDPPFKFMVVVWQFIVLKNFFKFLFLKFLTFMVIPNIRSQEGT